MLLLLHVYICIPKPPNDLLRVARGCGGGILKTPNRARGRTRGAYVRPPFAGWCANSPVRAPPPLDPSCRVVAAAPKPFCARSLACVMGCARLLAKGGSPGEKPFRSSLLGIITFRGVRVGAGREGLCYHSTMCVQYNTSGERRAHAFTAKTAQYARFRVREGGIYNKPPLTFGTPAVRVCVCARPSVHIRL